MFFKEAEHRSNNSRFKELSEFFYLIYNPALTIPLTVLMIYFERSLLPLFLLHVLNLALYKAVPMLHYGANSEMDLSNHVSSVLFLLTATWYTGLIDWLVIPLFLFIAATSTFSVVEREQHTLGGALLGAASTIIIFATSGMKTGFQVPSVVAVTGVLYLAFLQPQSFKHRP